MAASCGRCGSETPTDARFCPWCGETLTGGAAAPAGLLDPLGTADMARAAEPQSENSRLFLVVTLALLALVVGFFVVTGDDEDPADDAADADGEANAEETGDADDPDDDVRTDSTTTTEPAADDDEPSSAVVIGRLDWEPAADFGDGWVSGVVDIGDSTLVYLGSVDGFGLREGGLRAWERDADGQWIDHGTVIDDEAVGQVSGSASGAIAIGADADGNAVLWRSDDGLAWRSETLPPHPSADGGGVDPFAAVEFGDVTLVAAQPRDEFSSLYNDVRIALGDALRGTFPELAPAAGEAVVRAPFGFEMGRVTLADLGIDPPDLTQRQNPVGTLIWATDADGWTTSVIDDQYGAFYVPYADDGLAVGFSGPSGGMRLWTTVDGTEWHDAAMQEMWNVEAWDGGLLGSDGRRIMATAAADLSIWNELPTPPPLAGGTDTHLAVSSSPDGVTLRRFEDVFYESGDKEVLLVRDGYTLLASTSGPLELYRDGELVTTYSNLGSGAADRYRADLDAATVTLLDLATGDDALTVSVAELRQLQDSLYATTASPATVGHQLYATRDLETWYGGWLRLDSDEWITRVAVSGDTVLTTTTRTNTDGSQQHSRVFESPLPTTDG